MSDGHGNHGGHRIVTLDGPAGVGKTTLAKQVAKHLNVAYLDTGAMFRTVAWKLGKEAAQWPEDQLRQALAPMQFGIAGTGPETVLSLNGTPIGDEIRTEAVAEAASHVAGLPVVRTFLRQAQQDIGGRASLVAEGRDMGTVVFPQSRTKFFLTARPEVRAKRRVDQLKDMGKPADYDEILAQIQARDERDMNRATAPLKPAQDAITVDTSDITADQVLERLLQLVGERN